MKKDIKIWFLYTKKSFELILRTRFLMGVFVVGKLARIAMFLIFLGSLFLGIKTMGGYSREQVIFFYLSFNLIDTMGQMLFREVYRFRQQLVSGGLDFVLLKPVNPLVRVLLGGADLMDLFLLIALSVGVFWYGWNFVTQNPLNWILYGIFLVNGLVVSAGFYIVVMAIGILTMSVDHLVMIYRDFSSLMRIPIDFYSEPLRSFLIFILPVGIMISFPAKVLLGLLSLKMGIIAVGWSIILLFFAVRFWNYSLKFYQGAGG